MTKRLLIGLVLVTTLFASACGGDDDARGDASGTTEGSGGGSDQAATGDFCEVWPGLSDIQSGTLPSPGDIEEARGLIDDARASAPDEIEDDVDALLGLIEQVLDAVEGGEETDNEELFGQVFAVAITHGPPIEAYLEENCPDYEPSTFEDDGTGSLGIPDGDLDEMVREVFTDTNGADSSSSFGEFEWTIYTNGSANEALDGCTELSDRLAAHESATGTLKLTIGDDDGTPLAVNEKIEPGDAGECVAA